MPSRDRGTGVSSLKPALRSPTNRSCSCRSGATENVSGALSVDAITAASTVPDSIHMRIALLMPSYTLNVVSGASRSMDLANGAVTRRWKEKGIAKLN